MFLTEACNILKNRIRIPKRDIELQLAFDKIIAFVQSSNSQLRTIERNKFNEQVESQEIKDLREKYMAPIPAIVRFHIENKKRFKVAMMYKTAMRYKMFQDGYTSIMIGRVVRCDHSTVLWSISTAKNWLSTKDDEFTQIFATYTKHFEGEELMEKQ
jgi:hypothetical protein